MTPEQIRAHQNHIFATYTTIDEVIKWAEDADQSIVAIGIAVNTTLELIAKEIEREETQD
jgi:hypothetical protein